MPNKSVRIALCGLALFLSNLLIQAPAMGQKNGLSRAQVDHLIKLHAPDNLVASQIRTRGLSFSLTKIDLESLKTEGAGSETLGALREQIKVGTIRVQTAPDSAVTLDGKPVGLSGADGSLILKDIAEGNHSVIVHKDGFKDGSSQVILARNEVKLATVTLEWLGGYLSFDVKPKGAAIAVSGPTSFQGGLSETACPAGQYKITVSLGGYLPQSRTIAVASGEHHRETFELAMDPAVLAGKVDEAKSKLAAGDYAGAINASDTVLSQNPGNSDALVVLAEAAFGSGDMNRFVEAGTKAIRAGKSITVPVQHAHLLWKLRIHPVKLTVSRAGLSVVSNPPDESCKLPPPLGFDVIYSAQVIRDPHGFLDLKLQYSSKPGGHILHDLDFVPAASQIGRRVLQPGQIFSSTVPVVYEPANSSEILGGILKMMITAKSGT